MDEFAFLVPLGDRVVVEKIGNLEVSPGGIHVPTSVQADRPGGIVVAVGPGREMPDGKIVPLPSVIKVGARVLFGGSVHSAVQYKAKLYLVMSITNVLALMNDDPDPLMK